jgi:hypothetical protein
MCNITIIKRAVGRGYRSTENNKYDKRFVYKIIYLPNPVLLGKKISSRDRFRFGVHLYLEAYGRKKFVVRVTRFVNFPNLQNTEKALDYFWVIFSTFTKRF